MFWNFIVVFLHSRYYSPFVSIGPLEARAGVFGALPDAPQQGSAQGIETNDKRMLQAV